jgi:hypothetical protein
MATTPASEGESRSQRDRQERERDLVRELQELSGSRDRSQSPDEPAPREAGTVEEKERKER